MIQQNHKRQPITDIFLSVTILIAIFLSQPLYATTYTLPDPENDIIGTEETYMTVKGDTLAKIGTKHHVGLHELAEANPDLSLRRLPIGTEVIIPTKFILPPGPREGIVINLAELRLYYYTPNENTVQTFPIAIGKRGWQTPDLKTEVIEKVKDPAWHVPKSIKEYTYRTKGKWLPDVVPPGPDNPLGQHALRLGKRSYLIHGTPAKWSVGRRASSGCIRMYPDDIENLFSQVDVGTPVRIVNMPNKAGWADGKLYLESHKPLSDDEHRDSYLGYQDDMREKVLAIAVEYPYEIEWGYAENIAEHKEGRPKYIGYVESVAASAPIPVTVVKQTQVIESDQPNHEMDATQYFNEKALDERWRIE